MRGQTRAKQRSVGHYRLDLPGPEASLITKRLDNLQATYPLSDRDAKPKNDEQKDGFRRLKM